VNCNNYVTVSDEIKLSYSPCRQDSRLTFTASVFNRLKPVCQQSWSQCTLYTQNSSFLPLRWLKPSTYALHN